MKTGTMLRAGIMLVVMLMAVTGCSKGPTPPARENIPQVNFTPQVPNLPMVQAAPGGVGKVEWINKENNKRSVNVNKNDRLFLAGWVVNDKNGTVPPVVIVQLNAPNGVCFYAPASKTKQVRQDVAKTFNNPALANSSFQLDGSLSALPPGDFLVSFLLSDGKTYISGFDSGVVLHVK